MEYEFRSGGKTPKYANNGMCTLELHHGGCFENGVYKKGKVYYLDNIIEDFLSLLDLLKIGRGLGYEVDISQVEQHLEIRCKNPEGGLELVTSDATMVEMVGQIPSNKVIVLYYSEIEDYEYDANAENCDGDLTQNYQVNEVDYIEVEDEETFENVRTKVANEDVVKEVTNEDARVELPNEDIGAYFTIDNEGAELPNEDIGAHVTIDNEGAKLPNKDEDADSEIKDSDYEFSENEAEDRPTVGENIAGEGTSHGAPGEVSSDGADTSEFDSGSETDSEGNGRKKIKLPKFKRYRRDVDLKNPEFRLGTKFANKRLLIKAIKELAIIGGREIYGSKINIKEGTFAIKTLSLEHQCGRVDKLRHTTSKWLCHIYANKLKCNSNFDLKSFQQDVLEDYKINVTKLQVYMAKRLARDLNEGTFKEQYARLWDYAKELKTANKGSTVKIKTQIVKGETVFQMIYVCLAACKKGFLEGCRPFIGVNGCHLKGPYPGQILAAVGVDGNNGYFPVAYAVVDIETRATIVPWWEAEMEKRKNEDEKAWKWLKKRPAKNWSRSHFESHFKCDLLLNNLCESFNAAILDARDKTILSCLEKTRVYVMLWMANRRSACQNWRYSVGPRIFKIIEKNKNKLGSSQCIPRLAGKKLYQVNHIYGGEFVVDLRAKTCSCRRWNLCGIPCPHAISAIFQICENPIAYVDDCYKLETYIKAYEPVIHPIPSMDQWSKCGLSPIKPPLYKQQPGRPKRVRTKEPGEVEIPAPIPPNPMPPNYIAPPAKFRRVFIQIRCRGCGQKGHNRATYDRQNNETQQVHASSTQIEQGSSSNTMTRGNGEEGRGISRGIGNIAQAPAYPNSQESVTRGNGQGVLPSSHIGLGRGLPSSKLSAIRGRGLGRGISGGRGLGRGRGLPSSQSTVARGRGQGEPALDNISHDNNMASI
ncbi:hypothetical protein L3X38_009957 [Prunus dulcis]|uniref:SWIM-type domain-containing protein n=1 Tax=Prunus dulcis TaxID=3755 RepID=A0AAD4ZCV3_PRUDU|nr:hypothetical protein L3X38_009957 [Prunus dulcis]